MKNIYFLLYLPALFIFSLLSYKTFELIQLKEKTQSQEFIFYVSTDFNEFEFKDIFLAIKGWNYFLNSHPNLKFGENIEIFSNFDYEFHKNNCDNKNLNIIKIEKYVIDYYDVSSMFGNINLLGYTEPQQKIGDCKLRNIFLIDYGFDSDLKLNNVVMHEIGHAIGLDHIKNNDSIMSEFYSPNTTFFTQHDVEEYCKHYYCDNKIMNYLHITEEINFSFVQ